MIPGGGGGLGGENSKSYFTLTLMLRENHSLSLFDFLTLYIRLKVLFQAIRDFTERNK